MDEAWHNRRRRILEEYALMVGFDVLRESHSGGYVLWVNDWLSEEVMLLLEAKEALPEEKWKELVCKLLTEGDGRMPSLKEQEMYFAARNRALERHVETNALHQELEEGFSRGLSAADPSYADTDADDPSKYIERVKTETNFGTGFVLGVLARLEAVKGKGYQASWQKRGEADGAMVNVERKFDRLDAVVRKGSVGETKSQVLGDLAVYASKWLVYRAELNPEEFVAWVKEVQNL